MERGFGPDLLVVDAVGLALTEGDLREITFLRGTVPLVLLTSGQYVDQAAAGLAPDVTIRRPTTVGELAEAVERVLSSGSP